MILYSYGISEVPVSIFLAQLGPRTLYCSIRDIELVFTAVN